MNFWDNLMEDDEHAATYMETYGEGPGCETRLTLASFINDGETVLDVGCGPGWNLDHFRAYGPDIKDYQGLDYSERFVRVANLRHPIDIYDYEKPYYILGDVRDFKQPERSWDVVIMQDVLEHTNGYEKPVTEALRVARKRVIVTFWHLDDTDNPHINDDGDDGWGAWYDKGTWERFLDSLDIHWMHHQLDQGNRKRDYYVIDLEETHGKRTNGRTNPTQATGGGR